MKLIPEEGLWPGYIPDGQGEEMEGVNCDRETSKDGFNVQSNSKITTLIKLRLSSHVSTSIHPPSIVSCALGITNVPVPAVCIDCVF